MLKCASNLSERLPGKVQTNNRAEMYASRPRSLFFHGLAQPETDMSRTPRLSRGYWSLIRIQIYP